MSGWIKWEKDLETDPRFVRIVRKMRNGSYAAALPERAVVTLIAGALLRFWAYADTHIRTDDTMDLGFADVDELVGIPGFAESMPADWLRSVDETTVQLPGYQLHNGVEARKRDLAAKRMENKRLRDGVTAVTQQSNGSVMVASPDQTRPDQTKETPSESTARAERVGRKSLRSRRVPQDFAPDLDFARSQIPDIDAEREAQKFRDWEFKTPRSDWPAVWRTWVGNCRESGKYARRAPQGAGTEMLFAGKPVKWQ